MATLEISEKSLGNPLFSMLKSSMFQPASLDKTRKRRPATTRLILPDFWCGGGLDSQFRENIRNSHQTSCNNLIFTIFFGWHLHSSSLVYYKFKPTHNPIFFPRLNFPFTSVQEVNCHQPTASLFVLQGGWPTSVHIADLKRTSERIIPRIATGKSPGF